MAYEKQQYFSGTKYNNIIKITNNNNNNNNNNNDDNCNNNNFFFSIWVFFHEHSRFTG